MMTTAHSQLTGEPSISHIPSKLHTPPLSSAGSTHDPLVVHDSDEDIGAEGSDVQPIHHRPGPAEPSKRRNSSPERKHIPDLLPSPSSSIKDKGKQPAFKKRKCDVFVLVPSERKHSVKTSPTSPKLERKHVPFSPPRQKLYDPWDDSSDSSLTSLSDDDDNNDDSYPPSRRPGPATISRERTSSKGPSRVAQRHRSPERELTYFDSPIPMPMDLDDGRDSSYVPSRRASPVPPTSARRPSRTDSSQKTEAQPKPPALSSPVRSATISGKSSPTRAAPGPSSQQRLPQASPPQRRVTLHVSPPSPVAAPLDRLSGLTRFGVHIADPAILRPTVSRKRFSELLGGSTMRMCVPLGGRNFLFPTLKQNPRLPSDVGQPGLLLRANVEAEWKGDVQTVLVGLRGAEYKYVGEYRMTRGERLSVDEYRALSDPLRRKWANGVVNKSKFKDIRVRIRTRRQHNREATVEEIALALADKDNKWEVSEEDIMQGIPERAGTVARVAYAVCGI
ncbi:hypothetical protein LXA43DRAFT_531723 [Ganoderma leucocontextum]|nr:hypothetical protein LXA43DRAFT_531723 [Ganoderma leucocontextum]